RLRLTKMRNVDHRSQTRKKARQAVHEIQSTTDLYPGVTRSFLRKADRVIAAAERGPMKPPPKKRDGRDEDKKLSRHDSADITLPEKKKRRREPGVVFDPSCEAFGDSAKYRERSQRHDQRWSFELRDHRRVERTTEQSDYESDRDRDRHRQTGVAP